MSPIIVFVCLLVHLFVILCVTSHCVCVSVSASVCDSVSPVIVFVCLLVHLFVIVCHQSLCLCVC